jgi:hypothetical protein
MRTFAAPMCETLATQRWLVASQTGQITSNVGGSMDCSTIRDDAVSHIGTAKVRKSLTPRS